MDIVGAFSTLTNIGSITKLMIEERDRQKMAELQSKLQSQIIEAQNQLIDIIGKATEQQSRISLQEKKIHELEDLLDFRDSYQLELLSKQAGFYAYKYVRDDKVEHYLCQTCLDTSNSRQVLRIREDSFCSCPGCGNDKGLWLKEENRPTAVYRVTDKGGRFSGPRGF